MSQDCCIYKNKSKGFVFSLGQKQKLKKHQDCLDKKIPIFRMFSQDHNVLLNKGIKPPIRLDASNGSVSSILKALSMLETTYSFYSH